MKAKDIMNQNPFTIHADATISELVNFFKDKKIDGVCVVEGANKLVGVITIFELFQAYLPDYVKMKKQLSHLVHEGYFEEKCKELRDQPIRTIMKTDVVTIKEEDRLISIVAHIAEFRLEVFPVTREDTLVGMIHKKGLLTYTGRVLVEDNPANS